MEIYKGKRKTLPIKYIYIKILGRKYTPTNGTIDANGNLLFDLVDQGVDWWDNYIILKPIERK